MAIKKSELIGALDDCADRLSQHHHPDEDDKKTCLKCMVLSRARLLADRLARGEVVE